VAVVNPFAKELTFLDTATRTRRDHEKYLGLIKAVTFLLQYQRPRKALLIEGKEVSYIESTPEDIAIANEVALEILGRTLDDVPPQARRLLLSLDAFVSKQCQEHELERQDYRSTARQARELMGWSYEQTRAHLGRLVDMEYALVHRGGRGQSYVYELLYDGQGKDGRPFLIGLIDAETLCPGASTTKTLGGLLARFGGSSRVHTGSIQAPYRGALDGRNPLMDAASSGSDPKNAENAYIGGSEKKGSSYIDPRRTRTPKNGQPPAGAPAPSS
jgi:hypothetical protein